MLDFDWSFFSLLMSNGILIGLMYSLIALGFVATALVAGWFARFLGFAFVDRLHHGSGAVTFAPALTPLTGLAVVWGLVAGLGTAFWWSWSRGLQWTTGAVAGPSDAPPSAT